MRTDQDIRIEVVLALSACDPAYVHEHDLDAIVRELLSLERTGGYDESTFWDVVERHQLPVSVYRVWAVLEPGRRLPVSQPFDTREAAQEWATRLNTDDYRVWREDS